MATLREVQLAELEIFKYFDSICKKKNLRYSMIGGTMLGAIRHKGFIPWDDDIDVYMPLEDVRKLAQLIESDLYFLQIPKTDIQMPFIMPKLRKKHTTMIEPGTEGLDINQGVWMDIFPYVNAGTTKTALKMQTFLRSILQTYRCRYRYTHAKNRWLHKLLTKFSIRFQIGIDTMLENMIKKMGSNKSGYYFALDPGWVTVHSKELFDNVKNYQFEDGLFLGINDYDKYLRSVYGDNYMIPQKWNHVGDYSNVIL